MTDPRIMSRPSVSDEEFRYAMAMNAIHRERDARIKAHLSTTLYADYEFPGEVRSGDDPLDGDVSSMAACLCAEANGIGFTEASKMTGHGAIMWDRLAKLTIAHIPYLKGRYK